MTMTDAQYLAMQVAARGGHGRFAFSVAWNSTVLRYTTGDSAVTIDSEVFTPRAVEVPKITIGNDDETSFSFKVANEAPGDALSLSQRHLQVRFSGETMVWYFGVMTEDGWTEIYRYSWDVASGHIDPYSSWFGFNLRSGVGTRPRAGQARWGRTCNLIVGGTTCGATPGSVCDGSLARCATLGRLDSNRSLVLAPEPDFQLQMFNSNRSNIVIHSSYVGYPPDPGGQAGPRDGGNWRNPGSGGRRLTPDGWRNPTPVMQNLIAAASGHTVAGS